jgi:hypothetical protein
MTSATGDKNSVTVKLHRALYAADAITEAAATFGEFATFSVHAEGDHYIVALSEIDHEVEGDVVAEFCNFALANTAVRSKNLA